MTSTCVMLNMMRYHLSLGGTLLHRPSKFIQNGEEFNIASFYTRFTVFIQEALDFYLMDRVANYDAAKVRNLFLIVFKLRYFQSFPLLGINNFHISQLTQQSSYYMTEELNSLLWPAPGNSPSKSGEVDNNNCSFSIKSTSSRWLLLLPTLNSSKKVSRIYK